MRKLKTIMFILSAIFVMGSFGGCSSAGLGDERVNPNATELTFFAQDFEEWNNKWLRDKVKQFNDIVGNDTYIDMSMYQDADYSTKLKSARNTNSAPDINMTSYGNLAPDIKNGYVAPLNDLIEQEYLDDILSYVKDMVCYDGQYYAYPQLVEPSSFLFYRKDWLDQWENDIPVKKDPSEWSFADLVAVCQAVKPKLPKQRYTIGLPVGFPLAWSTTGLIENSMGTKILNDNWDTCLLDSTIVPASSANYQSENGLANMLRLYWNLYAGSYVPLGNMTARGYNDIIEAMCQDKLVMTFAGSWSVAEIYNSYPSYADKIGIAPVPTMTGDKSGVTATNGGWAFCVSAQSNADKQAKAAKFISWLLAEDAQRTASFFTAAHYSKNTARQSVADYIEANADSKYDKWRSVINDVAAKSIPEPLYPFDISLKVAYMFEQVSIYAASLPDNAVDAMFSGYISTAITEINKIIADNELAGTNPKHQA